jgi:hypothetical protein
MKILIKVKETFVNRVILIWLMRMRLFATVEGHEVEGHDRITVSDMN